MKCVSSSSLLSSQVNVPWWSEDKWCSVRLPDADTFSICCLNCSETLGGLSTPVWSTMIWLWLNFHSRCVGGLVFGAVQWIVVVPLGDTWTGAEKKRDQIISPLSECGFRLWCDFLNIFSHQNDSCGGGCDLADFNQPLDYSASCSHFNLVRRNKIIIIYVSKDAGVVLLYKNNNKVTSHVILVYVICKSTNKPALLTKRHWIKKYFCNSSISWSTLKPIIYIKLNQYKLVKLHVSCNTLP